MLQELMTVAMAVVYDEKGRILLVQESKAQCRGLWSIPGGRAEAQETILEALHREVLEEAGVTIKAESLIFMEQETGFRTVFRFIFKARCIGGEPKNFEDEHSMGARWFTLEEVGELPLRGDFIAMMIKLASSNEPALRTKNIWVLSDQE